MNILEITICKDATEAPNYQTGGELFKGVELRKAIIVRNGTENGHDTIDLQFVDSMTGQKYVALTTAKLLKTLTDLTQ